MIMGRFTLPNNIKLLIDRYEVHFDNLEYVFVANRCYSCPPDRFFTDRRIILREIPGTSSLIATFCDQECYSNKSTIIIRDKHTKYSLSYLLTILNCRLLYWYFLLVASKSDQNLFPRLSLTNTRQLPIRRINFTTPESERKKLVNNLTTQYKTAQSDQVLTQVEECLPKDKDDNFITDQEKSDVIHDFLAFLAEQMIKMNKEKQAEIKNFFSWLKDVHGIDKDVLKPKTYLNKFYKLESGDLFKHLEKNKIKPNPTDYSRIKNAFEESVNKLRPLIQRMETTDCLIDQVVYKLYGLTEEEIKIVEGK